MAATQGSNKETTNLVHFNERWASRVKREKDAAKEWQRMFFILSVGYIIKSFVRDFVSLTVKWAISDDLENKKEQLLNSVVESKVHAFLERTQKPSATVTKLNGTQAETIDSTLAKTLFPCTYHLVGQSVTTMGVSPTQKYDLPQTTSQQVGWFATNIKNLELPFTEGRRIQTDITNGGKKNLENYATDI